MKLTRKERYLQSRADRQMYQEQQKAKTREAMDAEAKQRAIDLAKFPDCEREAILTVEAIRRRFLGSNASSWYPIPEWLSSHAIIGHEDRMAAILLTGMGLFVDSPPGSIGNCLEDVRWGLLAGMWAEIGVEGGPVSFLAALESLQEKIPEFRFECLYCKDRERYVPYTCTFTYSESNIPKNDEAGLEEVESE